MLQLVVLAVQIGNGALLATGGAELANGGSITLLILTYVIFIGFSSIVWEDSAM
ncbi:MAG: hypothetical protein PHI32_15615 [Dysgonamonadaceae bacterium]|nr:hypothetical protein [Dysgonamonadaceae bacterium]MDD4681382.1 hypothetical protein [Clostridia bacterium]